MVASAMTGLCLTVSAAVAVSETAGQGMELAAPLADHAVLQRQMPVPVWGWSKLIPGSFKGIIFLTGPAMTKADQGENSGPGLTALANSFIEDFGGKAKFIDTIPDKSLAPEITAPFKINGASVAVPISDWQEKAITPERVDQIIKAIGD